MHGGTKIKIMIMLYLFLSTRHASRLCVVLGCTEISQLHFLHLPRKRQAVVINVPKTALKVSVILNQFQKNLQITLKISNTKYHENLSMVAEMFHANRQIYDEANSRFSQLFCKSTQ
jgi:hypothetical protein